MIVETFKETFTAVSGQAEYVYKKPDRFAMTPSNQRVEGRAKVEIEWIHERSADNSARYVLGTAGVNPLVCFGINPSTAKPDELDPTLTRVSKYALTNGFDSWIILNIYPQRKTNPRKMHLKLNEEWHKENLKRITGVLTGKNYALWAAWGENITTRPYLINCLKDIDKAVQQTDCRWYTLGQSENQHPFHPLYRGKGFRLYTSPLSEFDIKKYINMMHAPV